jgi:glycosyltransferase involved in cell wall biosynthesis
MVASSEAVSGLLSVIIPAHNRASLLDVAIASVLTSPLIASSRQIIVVDDDSRDRTEEVSRRHGVTYVRANHHNISRSRNAGLALVQTPYVAFLDHDDAWLPGNMQAQLDALESHPDAAFAYGIARCASEDFEPLPWTFPSPPLPSGIVPEQLHLGYPNLGVVLFRREAVVEVGGFDPRIAYHQDGDLMIRVAARREIVGIEIVGMLHRMRTPSKSSCDYYWANREVTRWRPKNVGVGWKAAIKLNLKTRGLFFHRFYHDAAACLAHGNRRDALLCLSRALRISPERALLHFRRLGSVLWRCIRGTDQRSLATP